LELARIYAGDLDWLVQLPEGLAAETMPVGPEAVAVFVRATASCDFYQTSGMNVCDCMGGRT
jgi:hypothetical protein